MNEVDLRDSKLKGSKLEAEADKRCVKAIKGVNKGDETIPSVLLMSRDQFKEFVTLQEEPSAEPTGKEMLKSSNGYIFEIKVEKESENV